MEDRSALFNQLKNFSQRKLKKVETKVVTGTGEQLVEKRGAKGLQVLTGSDGAKIDSQNDEPPRKLDLQVGLIVPGLLIGSQDVAHDKSSLDNYGVTHVLNLASDVSNVFEDDYNYKNVSIIDKPDFELEKILDDCFDFIDDGRHYGNVLVHCAGTIGLSRSTSICIAYLMNKEKQKFDEAFNNVKEARSFVRPNEGFIKQLKDYEVKLRGAQQVKDSGIDDPFALRKKQEIEQEKAMVAGAASVKNRMKMFGSTLDANSGGSSRSKSVSPSPYKSQSEQASPKPVSKWSKPEVASQATNSGASNKSISKSMTPEPRKSWQSRIDGGDSSSSVGKTSSSKFTSTPPPPPPPPPPPSSGLLDDARGSKPSSKSSAPPPPPPPPPSADFMTPSSQSASTRSARGDRPRSPDSSSQERMVFGRVRPPPMKITGGMSIEKNDSASETNSGYASKSTTHSPTIQVNHNQLRYNNNSDLRQRCASPLVLLNNIQSSSRSDSQNQNDKSETEEQTEPQMNPFKFWNQHLEETRHKQSMNSFGQLPKRTISLGNRSEPPRPQKPIGAALKQNPFLNSRVTSPQPQTPTEFKENQLKYNKMTKDLNTSLNELSQLIDSKPSLRVVSKPPKPMTSYLTTQPQSLTVSCKTTSGRGDEDNISLPGERQFITQFEEDRQNWQTSASILDLRSMFEQKSTSMLSIPDANDMRQRPPRSASPSVLKQLPWLTQSSQNHQENAAQYSSAGRPSGSGYADYTIRRTTSTSSSKSRNPYRSNYGNF